MMRKKTSPPENPATRAPTAGGRVERLLSAADNSPQPIQDPVPAGQPTLEDEELAAFLVQSYDRLRAEVAKFIVGQDEVVDLTPSAILSGGHGLLVGVPGLAKTLLVSSLAETMSLGFKRIQFTPDLMPSDITGTEVIYTDPATGEREFKFLRGPIFANIVLADEINRTPPKTQAAMLEDPDSTFVLQGSEALTVEFPIGAGVEVGAEKVSIIVIDTPAATDIYTDETLQKFEDAGLEVEIIPVAFGTLDMTPQARQVVQDNPNGLVNIVGHDAFCIPAIQGLEAAGFTGTIGTISYCITDAMREAIPSDAVEGILLAASDTLADPNDPSTVQYNAVMDEFATSDIPRDSSSPNAIFTDIAALAIGTAGLEGEVTPESIIEAMRSMDNEVLPGTGGRQFRCNSNASGANPSVCMNSGLSATLGADGLPVSYTVFNDEPIPD